MEIMLAGFLQGLIEKYPVAMTIISIMGMARLIIKPTMVYLHEVVLVTETKKDDEMLAKVEGSKAYKAILFVLDWFTSIKVKK